MSARIFIGLVLMSLVTTAVAQGFGGLGQSAEGYSVPQRGKQLEFPKDHLAHPGFRIEWWYLTANLKGEDGRDYGVQWTLFRSAIIPPGENETKSSWSSPHLWMGHAAVTTPERHFVAETRARGGIGQAGVEGKPFNAWIDDWYLKSKAQDGEDAYARMEMVASGKDFSYQFDLTAKGPLIFHGDKGYSVKSATGQASHYYSQPFYEISGVLNLPGGPVKVSGNAWLDREWSSQPLAENQKGWDWISLHFDDGAKLMGFRLRGEDGDEFTSGTWISAAGETTPYSNGSVKLTPLETAQVSNRTVPVKWRVELPAQKLDVILRALNNKAWMAASVPYWEGPVKISGSKAGLGYLEMTGYE